MYTLLATTDHLTVLAENHVTSPSPPLPPQKILFLPPSLSQLLAVFMITNLNNDEYLGVFPWNALSPRNDGSLTYFGLSQNRR